MPTNIQNPVSTMMSDPAFLWPIRAFIYRHFAETTRPPTAAETAAEFQISEAQAASAYAELHQRHAVFLDGETGAIRMANPFSAVPTAFRVQAGGRAYFANCAWDALGIPAALHSDADIEANCAGSGESLGLAVRTGQVVSQGELIHFLVPFRRWYEDMIFT